MHAFRAIPTSLGLTAAIGLAAAMLPGTASAASFPELAAKGYQISPMTKSRGGRAGWIMRGTRDSYFCVLVPGMVRAGNGYVSLSTSAYETPASKAVIDRVTGGAGLNLPQLADLKAGRVPPQKVGRCFFYR
ncbi:hypothetical protein DYI37_17840 [Fulvimarina endophytica]|uniref:Uncharacterized protein n=1 Tax=Fulvimarina endophytica TaxID=2293836 RepID=A0A371WYN9_9HYPH|nr:hypothetical protein [Fulvimarina endophytica]RFC62105.1 hypothetical protein DYI37_17840 [Fulvimarina endophytica]